MDVKEFVSTTLKQIIDGVVDAQNETKGSDAVIVPYGDPGGNVGFNIALNVMEGTEKGGKAGLRVWAVGADVSGKTESSSSVVTHVTFSVPIELPKGEEQPDYP